LLLMSGSEVGGLCDTQSERCSNQNDSTFEDG
jgi:hypothetical protein